MREITYRRKKKTGIFVSIVIFLIVLFCVIVFGLFRVQKITIIGNEHYTSSQIQEAIMQDGLCKNTIYLMWKFEDQEKVLESLPFLSGAEAEMIKPYEVQVTVFEKPQIGYLLNQGSYVYFDKDGMVVEMSGEVHKGVPLITGLEVEKAELYEQLPVTDDSLYNIIVTLSKALNKNEIVPEEIRFGTRNTITLVFETINVNLGDDTALEDKIAALDSILDQLEGESGILHMEGYTENDGTVTFKSESATSEMVTDIDFGDEPSLSDGDDTSADGTSADGTSGDSQGAQTQNPTGPTYSESDGTFSTDAQGNRIYTDKNGVTTTMCDQYNYTDENGNIITDGYGYIDPYTGSYILGSQ